MPEERLARWAARGSEAAFAVIFERHHQALHRYCHSIVGNGHDASDALQSTMLKAFRALSGETREINLRPWLYRIAHNESISLLRARRSDADLDSAAQVGDPSTEALIESRDRLRALAADLTELTEQQRGALLMRELGGLEFAEVADALGTSASAVKQSAYEARCALQSMQEGRAMECETVRRTLSDGDRRMLRGMRMRGHLRACAGCRDFEVGLQRRPAQLAAMVPPLPVAAAAGILHTLLGGGGSGGGGGLIGGLAGTAQATTGISLAAKAGAVAAVTATIAGGAVYAVPELGSASPERSVPRSQPASTPRSTWMPAGAAARDAGSRGSAAKRSTRDRAGDRGVRASARAKSSGAGKHAGTPGGKPAGAGKPAGTPGGKPAGAGKHAGTPGGRPAGAGKPAGTPGGRPAGTPRRSPASPAGGPALWPDPPATTPGASAVAEHRPTR